jgi:hypothetical protein
MVALRQGKAELTLQRGVSVSGKVVDAKGEPVVGAAVACGQGNGRAVTNGRGEFTLRGLSDGTEYTVTVEEWTRVRGSSTVTAREGARVELRMGD